MSEFTQYNIEAQDQILPENSSPKITFLDWAEVPKSYKTREAWLRQFRAIRKNEKPSAVVIVEEKRKRWLESIGETREIKVTREFSLFHLDQTYIQKKTPLQLARIAFYDLFLNGASRTQHIKWTKGEWQTNEEGKRFWDSTVDSWGWLTCRGSLGLKCAADHINGAERYGVYGCDKSAYLLIDLDLHNQPLVLFLKRLSALLDWFHGKHACHFQVADDGARGIHLILYFGKSGDLATRHRWITRQLAELDQRFGDTAFTKLVNGERLLNIEVYPCQNSHRLPLCSGRTMLLDKPLELIERRARQVQDVVGYVSWLNDKERQYMDKDDIYRHVLERLDLDCSSTFSSNEQSGKVQKTAKVQAPNAKSKTGSLKGKTRSAIIGLWRDGLLGPFSHLNDAINVTLRALYFEDLLEDDAVAIVERYLDELPNNDLSSRLPHRISELVDVARRDAVKIWNNNGGQRDPEGSKRIWEQTIAGWQKIGFQVSDKATWNKLSRPKTVVDCPEIEFTEAERQLINSEMAPLLVGNKQAKKANKQEIVIKAVNYFLRFVKCHDGEIATSWLPEILGDFDIKLGNYDKRRHFFDLLRKWDWIYVRAEYFHPQQHGKKGRGRARSYGIGPAMAAKFGGEDELSQTSYTTNKQDRPIIVTHFFEEPFDGSDLPSFDAQISELNKQPTN